MAVGVDTPTIEDLIRIVAQGDSRAEVGPLPARVESYNPSQQSCDATPLVLVPGPEGLQTAPMVRSVPVMWPSGGGWSLHGPMAAGDLVWLVPAGADIGHWVVSGAVRSVAATERRLSLSDVVAIPGGRPFSSPLSASAVASDGVVLAGSKVYLGDSTASKKVVLDGDRAVQTLAMGTWMSQVEVAINALAPGAVLPLSDAIPEIATVASTATKVIAK